MQPTGGGLKHQAAVAARSAGRSKYSREQAPAYYTGVRSKPASVKLSQNWIGTRGPHCAGCDTGISGTGTKHCGGRTRSSCEQAPAYCTSMRPSANRRETVRANSLGPEVLGHRLQDGQLTQSQEAPRPHKASQVRCKRHKAAHKRQHIEKLHLGAYETPSNQ